MTQAPTLAEALQADEERFTVARGVLLAEYRRLLQARPDGPAASVGAIGPDRWGPMALPPGAVENWQETLPDEDARTLKVIAERLKFDKKTIALHALAVGRLRRLDRKLATCGPGGSAGATERFKVAEKEFWAANAGVLEAQKKVGAAVACLETSQIRFRKALMLEGDRMILRQQFGTILPD